MADPVFSEQSLHHSHRCLDECIVHTLGGFDLAYAHEAIDRARPVGGDLSAAAAAITDGDDRALLVADLATLPA